MAATIPDLWSEESQVDDFAPVIILNPQAAILQKRAKGIVGAEVIERKSGAVTERCFNIKSQVARHRSRRLVRRHLNDDVYPH